MSLSLSESGCWCCGGGGGGGGDGGGGEGEDGVCNCGEGADLSSEALFLVIYDFYQNKTYPANTGTFPERSLNVRFWFAERSPGTFWER